MRKEKSQQEERDQVIQSQVERALNITDRAFTNFQGNYLKTLAGEVAFGFTLLSTILLIALDDDSLENSD